MAVILRLWNLRPFFYAYTKQTGFYPNCADRCYVTINQQIKF